eukprot:442642-Prymnesium_polylepis.3
MATVTKCTHAGMGVCYYRLFSGHVCMWPTPLSVGIQPDVGDRHLGIPVCSDPPPSLQSVTPIKKTGL